VNAPDKNRYEVRADLTELFVAYAVAVDNRDWDRYESLFMPEALIDYRKAWGPILGAPEARKWIEASLTKDRLLACQHLLSNIHFDFAGPVVLGHAGYFNADVVAVAGETTLRVNGGSYTAEFVEATDGWRMRSLVAELLWSVVTDPSATVFPFLGAAPPTRSS
jgi:hypothetical protein